MHLNLYIGDRFSKQVGRKGDSLYRVTWMKGVWFFSEINGTIGEIY